MKPAARKPPSTLGTPAAPVDVRQVYRDALTRKIQHLAKLKYESPSSIYEVHLEPVDRSDSED